MKKKNQYEKPTLEHLDIVGQGASAGPCAAGSGAAGACGPSGGNAGGGCSTGTSGF